MDWGGFYYDLCWPHKDNDMTYLPNAPTIDTLFFQGMSLIII
jgi:hypothetical protein